MITKCLNCQKELQTTPYRLSNGRGKFCSRSCSGKYYVGEKSRNWHGGYKSKLPKCIECGKQLTNPNNKYCKRHAHSGERSYEWLGGINRPKNKCQDCGKELKNRYAKHCLSCMNKGNRSYLWKGGITPESHAQRVLFKNKVQKLVLKRDGYTCQICGKKGGVLHVDHIQPWSEYLEGRFEINNCRTLCIDCHYKVTFGKERPKNSTWGLKFLRLEVSN